MFDRTTEINELASGLYQRYGIRVIPEFTCPVGWGALARLSGDRAGPDEICRTLAIVELALADYPVEFVKNTVFKNLVICKDLATPEGWASAVTERSIDWWYMGADDLCFHERVIRRNTHHEVFHMMSRQKDDRFDQFWSGLNEGTFAYAPDPTKTGTKWSDRPGFLSEYATTSVDEDQAEVFACMMTRPGEVSLRAKADQIVRRKVEMMNLFVKPFRLTWKPERN